MRTTFFSLLAVIAAANGFAQQSVTARFPLKWKTHIGVTTYRTNMLLHDGRIYIGSNGNSREDRNDPYDGVYAIDAKTGAVQQRYAVPFAGDDDVTGIAIADNKLFFGTDNFYFFCFDIASGEELWKKSLPYDVESTPVTEDFNGDGITDVSFSVEGSGFYALNGKDGSEIWAQNAISSYCGNVAALAVDIDLDGVKDIVTAGRGAPEPASFDGYTIDPYADYHFALNGKSGEILWILPAGAAIHASPFLFEVAGEKRLALLDTYSGIQVTDLQGQLVSHASFGGCFCSPVMTKDAHFISGSQSIGYSADGMTTSYDDLVPHPAEHVEFNSVSFGDNTEIISATTMVADVLGIGTVQGIGVTEQGTLFLMRTNGKTIAKLKLPGAGAEASPFIADLDGDGMLEILIADLDGHLYCFGTSSKGKVEVGQFR